MSVSLAELRVGERVKILGFKSGSSRYAHRLLCLGIIPQTEFTVTSIAPLGDPVALKIHTLSHNASLCLRKQEASILDLERV